MPPATRRPPWPSWSRSRTPCLHHHHHHHHLHLHPPPPPPPPPSSGLVAAWGFNEGSGSTTADATGKGHAGTLSNATWTAGGKFGAALSFDGSSSWVTVADAPDLDLSDGMTLEAWVRPSALGTSWRTVLFKERSGGVVYSLYANQYSGLPVGQVYIGGEQNATGIAQLALDTWTHVGSPSTARACGSTSTAHSRTRRRQRRYRRLDGPLRIGGNAIWNEWFDGLIDELRIYDRALSPTEIQTDMQTPSRTQARRACRWPDRRHQRQHSQLELDGLERQRRSPLRPLPQHQRRLHAQPGKPDQSTNRDKLHRP